MKYDFVIFDLDGTLIDSRGDLTKAVNVMRTQYDLAPLAEEVVVSFVGDGVRKLVERSLAGASVNIEDGLRTMYAYYREHLVERTFCYEGVKEGLLRLQSAGITMALASNKAVELCREILAGLGIDHYFSAILGGGSATRMKPFPDIIHLASELCDKTLKNAVMVGDHHTDLLAAQQAQIPAVYVSYGLGNPHEVGYDFEASGFPELVDYLLNT